MAEHIKDNTVVTIAYRMGTDGTVLEDAPADDPLYYLHGADNLVPGLEAALLGKQVGDTVSITLPPADAYGERDEESVQAADINDFNLPENVEVGAEVEVEDAEGDIYMATIRGMDDKAITLDFNHPLAGMYITFDVEVLEIREATAQETKLGEPAEYHMPNALEDAEDVLDTLDEIDEEEDQT